MKYRLVGLAMIMIALIAVFFTVHPSLELVASTMTALLDMVEILAIVACAVIGVLFLILGKPDPMGD